ncbi:4-hydroxyphenylacetate 3-hydroxylase C-terminal domain-containing protein [Streptomyces sp. NPDC020951]|uniref:4-hydroxyphenylacetate 3-hydroxylase C-terminal domain-containing protein n=1 Tax=Streptomyces sp. NPDC020951 TaxID=3365104 RepID=UPI00379C108D
MSIASPDRSRTGKSYLTGLADGRRVHLAGRLVEDLAHDPATEGMAGFLADLLDAHHPGGELVAADGRPWAFSLADSAQAVRDRVFIHADVAAANNLRPGTGMTAYAWHQSAVRAWIQAETVFDLADRCAKAAGRDQQQTVRQQLGELAGIVETLRGLVVSAETDARQDRFGHYTCHSVPLAASGMLHAKLYPRAIELLQQIVSSGLVMHPVTADEDPGSAGHQFMQTYFAGAGVDGLAHGRLLRAAADLTMNRFGSRQVLYERLFLGPPDAFQAKFYDLFIERRESTDTVLDDVTS